MSLRLPSKLFDATWRRAAEARESMPAFIRRVLRDRLQGSDGPPSEEE